MALPYYNYLLSTYEERERHKIQRKRIRDICDPFDLGDTEFQKLWRISKPMAMYIIEKLLSPVLEPRNADGLEVLQVDIVEVEMKWLGTTKNLFKSNFYF